MNHNRIPSWLCQLIKDQSAGPKIYRWTIDDIVHRTTESSAATASACAVGSDREYDRIHILGVGNIGRLFAASLARLPNPPPITLVVHKKSQLENWRSNPGLILQQHSSSNSGEHESGRTAPLIGFDVEMWSEEAPPWPRQPREIASCIRNLIVATKSHSSLAQVDWLRRYLGSPSTVMFAQNGMNKLWAPNGSEYNNARYSRNPLWLACIITHGVTSLGPFESVHTSPAGVVVGPVSTGGASDLSRNVSTSYLIEQLLASPQLNARYARGPELWVLQLEKLVVNSIINPLTAILRCNNGELFSDSERNGTMCFIIDKLLEEASNVIQGLVEYDRSSRELLANATLNSASGVDPVSMDRLSFPGLHNMLYSVGRVVKDNTSSMLQDVRLGKMTEIREFNGWFVEMADYLHSIDEDSDTPIDVAAHRALVDLVESGVSLNREQLSERLAVNRGETPPIANHTTTG